MELYLFSDSLRAGRFRGGGIFRTRPNRPRGSSVVSPGVKRPERGVDHALPSSAEVKERLELYLYPSAPQCYHGMFRVIFAFAVYLYVFEALLKFYLYRQNVDLHKVQIAFHQVLPVPVNDSSQVKFLRVKFRIFWAGRGQSV